MPEVAFTVKHESGAVPLEKVVRALAAAYPGHQAMVQVGTNVHPSHFKTGHDPIDALLVTNSTIHSAIAALEKTPYVLLNKIEVTQLPNKSILRYHTDDRLIGLVIVEYREERLKDAELLAEAISSQFTITDKATVVREHLPGQLRDSVLYYEKALSDLQAETTRLAKFNTKQIQEQSEYFRKQVKELNEQHEERRTALEADIQAKKEELSKEEANLAKRQLEFDLRTNTAVRRDLLKKMEEKIEQHKQIVLSPSTSNKRVPIHIVCIGAMTVGLALIGAFTWRALAAEQFDWHMLVPVSAGTLLFGCTLIYYILWNDQWLRQHSQAEFQNIQFSADILRASWVAELVFEWHKEKEVRDFPPELLGSFTQNLFKEVKDDAVKHPTETTADALSKITKLTVSPQHGVHIERKVK